MIKVIILFVIVMTWLGSGSSTPSEARALWPYSFLEERLEDVPMQQWSWDCGPASVATLLHFLDEAPSDIPGDTSPIEERISLSQLQQWLADRGVPTEGYHLELSHLQHYFANPQAPPLLIHQDDPTEHFSVLLGLTNGHAIIADPALGLESLPLGMFESEWSGYALHASAVSPPFSRQEEQVETARERLSLLDAEHSRARLDRGEPTYQFTTAMQRTIVPMIQPEDEHLVAVSEDTYSFTLGTTMPLTASLQVGAQIPISVSSLDGHTLGEPTWTASHHQPIGPTSRWQVGMRTDLTTHTINAQWEGVYDPLLFTVSGSVARTQGNAIPYAEAGLLFAANRRWGIGFSVMAAPTATAITHRLVRNGERYRMNTSLTMDPAGDFVRFSVGLQIGQE